MPCLACATSVLRSFLGSLELGVSTKTALFSAPNLYRSGARRFYDASSNPRKLSTATHAIDTPQPSDSIALHNASTPFNDPIAERRRSHQQPQESRGKASLPARIQNGREEVDDQSAGVGGAYAIEHSASPEEYGKPQAKRPDNNSLDKDWWEKNNGELKKYDRLQGSPKTADSGGKTLAADHATTKPSSKSTKPPADPTEPPKLGALPWQIQKHALTTKFPPGWVPRKRLSPDTMEGIRTLHASYPTKYTTPVLADQFKVSPEAIRRILKSKWRLSDEEEEERRERWEKRGKKIWEDLSEKGVKPPRKWRGMGVGKRKPEGGWEKGPSRRERRMVAHLERVKETGGEGMAVGEGQSIETNESKERAVARAGRARIPKKGRPAIAAVRVESEYQVPLADRIL